MGSAEFKVKTMVLAPSETITIQFYGPNPMQVFKLMPELLMEVFRMDPGAMWEDEIRVDTVSDPSSFYGYWRAKEGKDAHTTLWIEIEVRGTQSKADRKGDVSITVKGKLKTSFTHVTPIHRGAFWFYNRVFYKKQMNKYIEEARKDVLEFEDVVRKHFDLMRREQ